MRYSSATRPVRLLNPWALLGAALLMAGLLFLLLQGEDSFMPDGQPDAVSATYAELLLAANPQARQLREELIDLLIDLGQYERAQGHIAYWVTSEPLLADYYQLVTNALIARRTADAEVLATTRQHLLAFDVTEVDPPRQVRFAELALSLEMPGLAADVYHSLARHEPEAATVYLEQAARWYMASVRPGDAARVFAELFVGAVDDDQRRHYLRLAYSSLLSADKAEDAAVLLAQHLTLLTGSESDALWLRQAKDSALGTLRYDLAGQFIERWRALQPDSIEALEAEFRLHLAFGDIFSAWQAGELLLVSRPADSALLKEMAQLGEWNGFNQQALSYWSRYLQLESDPLVLDYAWRRAFQMFDFQRGIPLLERLTAMRRLDDSELDSLVYAYESLGAPEEAEQWLHRYIQRQPGHRLARLRLAQNLENTHQYVEQSRLWADIAARFTLSLSERIEWASIHWRLFQPQQAWEVLDIPTDSIESPEYWQLRAALAWELELDDEVQFAYESMLAHGLVLSASEEDQLVDMYRLSDPDRALEQLIAHWRRRGDTRTLLDAINLAEQQGSWIVYDELVGEAAALPALAAMPGIALARADGAERANRNALAEKLYRDALASHPNNAAVQERFLWFLLDRGDKSEIDRYARAWRSRARATTNLWLPFAAACQTLGRWDEALAWYQLHLRNNPPDFLVQASYVDALEAAGRYDQAFHVRRALIARYREADVAATPADYATYLRLVATGSPRRAQELAALRQDGSPAMLQIWFDRLMVQLDATHQASAKAEWVSWAKSRGLAVQRFEELQVALRNHDREALHRHLESGELDAAEQVAALDVLGQPGKALDKALTSLGPDEPAYRLEQLRLQALELTERTPAGVQLGWQRRDFGGLETTGPRLLLAGHVGDSWHVSVELAEQRFRSAALDSSRLNSESNLRLGLRRPLDTGSIGLTVDSSQRADDDRFGLSVAHEWQATASDAFTLGLDWQVESDESGLMRALGQQDAAWLRARHRLSGREQLFWSVGHRSFTSRSGIHLGAGNAANIELSQIQQFDNPDWVLRTGIDYQRNTLSKRSLAALEVPQGGALNANLTSSSDFLQQDYGRVYVGSLWRRGMPGALNRTRAQYTWLVDLQTGWDWHSDELTYGLNAGIGTALTGNDELALTVGYQSAPRGGAGRSGGTLGLTYAMRFGR